jgi:hypothetical protein
VEGGTYVESGETAAVTVEGRIVEIGELKSDSVDVCHGFWLEGVESHRWRLWQRLRASD